MALAKGGRPERIGEILRQRLAALGWERRLREEDMLAGWEGAVGPQIAAHARPSHMTNGRLTVIAENPVWAQQLALLKTQLLRRVAARFGAEVVTDLYFVTGVFEPAPATPAPQERRAPRAEVPENFEAALADIADGEVRESVRRLIRAALADAGDR